MREVVAGCAMMRRKSGEAMIDALRVPAAPTAQDLIRSVSSLIDQNRAPGKTVLVTQRGRRFIEAFRVDRPGHEPRLQAPDAS